MFSIFLFKILSNVEFLTWNFPLGFNWFLSAVSCVLGQGSYYHAFQRKSLVVLL